MARKSPKEALSIVRKGDTVRLTATVTRVSDDDNPRLRKVTVTIPGYAIPITLDETSLPRAPARH
ncbi:MAG TPA: hypothetical protein VEC60_09840 [Reyranella sp.]|nr:hypothetical protein [Reyranella sp.]